MNTENFPLLEPEVEIPAFFVILLRKKSLSLSPQGRGQYGTRELWAFSIYTEIPEINSLSYVNVHTFLVRSTAGKLFSKGSPSFFSVGIFSDGNTCSFTSFTSFYQFPAIRGNIFGQEMWQLIRPRCLPSPERS